MATHYQGTEAEIRALDAYIKLSRAADSLTARIHRHLDASRLTISQFGVLEAIFHLGPLTQRDLAQKLLKSGGNMTLVIDNLEKRGLVRRDRQQKDRRCILVHLTKAGQALIEKVFPDHVAAIVAEMSILSEPEQEELSRLCRRLGKQE